MPVAKTNGQETSSEMHGMTKKSSLDIFFEVAHLEDQHELSLSATLFE